MIQRKKEHWFKMLFVWHGSVLPQLVPRLFLLLVLSVLIVFVNGTLYHYKIPLSPAPFTIFGIALALFLGFRNNASYDRFWEGRKLWGALLNDTRSLSRQALTLTGYDPKGKEIGDFVDMLIAFTYCLKHQLRKTDPSHDIQQRLPAELAEMLKNARFKPVILMREMGIWVKQAREKGLIEPICQVAIDDNLNKLSDIVGGCERIASTPIPYTYQVLLHRTVYLYCFLLPFGLVDSLGWITPFITVFIAYTFVAFEAIADELEDPFGTEPNDLPLNAMSRMIETTLLEIIGKPTLDTAEPDGYMLD
nr:bestrophin family ion channel [uncultured Dyadobacter sp.]